MKTPTIPTHMPPRTPAENLSRFVQKFLHIESAAGVVLLACAAIALTIANTPLRENFEALWSTTLTIGVGSFELSYPLWYWVNDGLMVLFFFVIGLEIKREMASGELSNKRAIILPLAAAVGGAAVPALVFLLVNGTGEGVRAWAVPTATDIAFVVGILALLGSRVPSALKIFLLSLAIFDDLIAVSIIAIFYSGSIGTGWLLAALAGFGIVVVFQRMGVRSIPAYVVVGAGVWLCMLKSGVHPTVAGVALGLMTPAHPLAGVETVAPTERLENALHAWIAFVVMPIFALANAGVAIQTELVGSSLALAISLGLLAGKIVGVPLGAWIAVRAGWSSLPRGVSWPVMFGAASLAGIGFTMSMFIASLAVTGTTLDAVKTGVLMGSLAAGLIGFFSLRILLPERRREVDPVTVPPAQPVPAPVATPQPRERELEEVLS